MDKGAEPFQTVSDILWLNILEDTWAQAQTRWLLLSLVPDEEA
jgi:hypothetical protein